MKYKLSERIFVDTSAWLAYLQPEEPRHKEIKKIFTKLTKERLILCLSNDVTDEIITLLVRKINKPLLKKFIKYLEEAKEEKSVTEFWVDEPTRGEALKLVDKYFEHKLSLTDATSLALMKRFKIKTIISLDSDFKKVGATVLP